MFILLRGAWPRRVCDLFQVIQETGTVMLVTPQPPSAPDSGLRRSRPRGPCGRVCSCPASVPVSPADWTVLGLGLAPKQGWGEGRARWALGGLPVSFLWVSQ